MKVASYIAVYWGHLTFLCVRTKKSSQVAVYPLKRSQKSTTHCRGEDPRQPVYSPSITPCAIVINCNNMTSRRMGSLRYTRHETWHCSISPRSTLPRRATEQPPSQRLQQRTYTSQRHHHLLHDPQSSIQHNTCSLRTYSVTLGEQELGQVGSILSSDSGDKSNSSSVVDWVRHCRGY